MLTKNQIVQEITEYTSEDRDDMGIRPNLVKAVLDALAMIAEEELADGEDFTVPGIARISYRYQTPLKKGERHKKGDTVVGFGGQERVAEEDSPARKAKVKLVAAPAGALKKLVPKGNDSDGQRTFLSSKAGKAIRARKG